MKKQESGIWRFKHLLPFVAEKNHLSLGEGNTRLRKIGNILFKCEYENPTGSVKDRSIAFQISKLFEQNIEKAVISSSGNAALSAANYCRLAKIDLTVFISPKIKKQKFIKLKSLSCHIRQTLRPVSAAFCYSRDNQAYDLRQSKDLNAVFGYETIVFELDSQEGKIDAIFLPVSSGTTLVGVASGYNKLGKLPAIHAVQTESVHPVSCLFDTNFRNKKRTLADAIVAKYTPRQEEIVEIIKKSKGWAWIISDAEMRKARVQLLNHKISCSYEGAAALAALWKAKKNGHRYKYPVCLLTGRYY